MIMLRIIDNNNKGFVFIQGHRSDIGMERRLKLNKEERQIYRPDYLHV